ncbi:MAG: crossover junction endodeoxyribonuclease RuvC [Candidatus Sumerlaeia bacterium]
MRIMGIDPGLASIGWGIIEYPGGGPDSVKWGAFKTDSKKSMAQRLLDIHNSIQAIIREHQPDVVSIEELFFATNVKTAIVVAQARGAIVLSTAESNLEVHEYTPLQIKKAVTGRGGAAKGQVQRMVASLLGLREIPKPDHAGDALAAALCHGHTLKTRRITQATGRNRR